jgi:hypothetical protein
MRPHSQEIVRKNGGVLVVVTGETRKTRARHLSPSDLFERPVLTSTLPKGGIRRLDL